MNDVDLNVVLMKSFSYWQHKEYLIHRMFSSRWKWWKWIMMIIF